MITSVREGEDEIKNESICSSNNINSPAISCVTQYEFVRLAEQEQAAPLDGRGEDYPVKIQFNSGASAYNAYIFS